METGIQFAGRKRMAFCTDKIGNKTCEKESGNLERLEG